MDPVLERLSEMFNFNILASGQTASAIYSDQIMLRYEFITPEHPETIIEILKENDLPVYSENVLFGEIKTRLGAFNVSISTFRINAYRFIKNVKDIKFVDSLTHTLMDRDFTVEALAINSKGFVFDASTARTDIKDRVIRACGIPHDKFCFNPLAMLKCARLVSRSGFNVHPETYAAIKSISVQILTIPKDSWLQELDSIVSSRHTGKALAMLADTNLLADISPGLSMTTTHDHYNLLEKFVVKMAQLEKSDKDLNWTYLFSMRKAHEITEIKKFLVDLLGDLDFDGVRADKIKRLTLGKIIYDRAGSINGESVKKVANMVGSKHVDQFMLLAKHTSFSPSEKLRYNTFKVVFQKLLASNKLYIELPKDLDKTIINEFELEKNCIEEVRCSIIELMMEGKIQYDASSEDIIKYINDLKEQ